MSNPGPAMRFLPVGARALLVELTDLSAVEALYAEALRRRERGLLAGLEEIVPAARTVLFDGVADPAELARQVRGWRCNLAPSRQERLVEVPTVYDGVDLPRVAELWQMSVREAIATHVALQHRVAFCGFAPGFAYIAGLPTALSVRRLATPRTRVPAGAVGVAGQFTGIYPLPSPGGWQLVGRTDLKLWDSRLEPPALLTPGTRVRFVEVSS
ncbi:MAG: 5-oxoprolinase subunit B family protein [Mycobacteriales bacterium]